jgi:hypothetical protein
LAAREGIAGIVVLNQLPDLFFKRHLAEQAIHSGLEDWIGELSVRWMRGFSPHRALKPVWRLVPLHSVRIRPLPARRLYRKEGRGSRSSPERLARRVFMKTPRWQHFDFIRGTNSLQMRNRDAQDDSLTLNY